MDYSDFEIGIYPGSWDNYSLHITYNRASKSDDEVRISVSDVKMDLSAFKAAEADPEQYGRLLSDSIFAHDKIRDAYANARNNAQESEAPLRVRIFLGQGVGKLQSLRWEAILDPVDQTRMAVNQNILLSRQINDSDWRLVRLRPRTGLRALLVVSNPNNIEEYGLPPIDVQAEIAFAKLALGDMRSLCIGHETPATPQSIFAALRDGYDVLYLVCHGAFRKGRPRLWLQDQNGDTNVVSGSEVVEQCKELKILPRLAVLASCQSAPDFGDEVDDRSSHLAPRLVEAGIPAVLGMQGLASIESTSTFMKAFFETLSRTGLVDEAASAARQSIRERPDWWVPALFMRLKSGRIWYSSGFTAHQPGGAKEDAETAKWQALMSNINNRECTPIVGPDIASALLGSRRELANRWADQYRFPMAQRDRENLPQVAQYLSVAMQKKFPRDELLRYAYSEALNHYHQKVPSDLATMATDDVAAALQSLVSDYGRRLRAENEAEPHNVLAQLQTNIYVTTNFGNQLEEALTEKGRDPVVELCRWNRFTDSLPTIEEREGKYRPSIDRPLVFKIFGQLSMPKSVVLTEDDYFDFLIGTARNMDLMPKPIRGALCENALLFLGYEMDEWDFRVLFRTIISQQGFGSDEDVSHVAATLDPEEGRIIEPERARLYLERYFTRANVEIFWGGTDEFLRILNRYLSR